jgi:hypothetical protein
MDSIEIITNNVPRDVINAWELTETERAEFDYLDWEAIEDGRDSAEFFRYKGQLYCIESEGTPRFAPGWHAYLPDSFFSGIVYRYPVDPDQPRNRDGDVNYDWERIVIGRYLVH